MISISFRSLFQNFTFCFPSGPIGVGPSIPIPWRKKKRKHACGTINSSEPKRNRPILKASDKSSDSMFLVRQNGLFSQKTSSATIQPFYSKPSRSSLTGPEKKPRRVKTIQISGSNQTPASRTNNLTAVESKSSNSITDSVSNFYNKAN